MTTAFLRATAHSQLINAMWLQFVALRKGDAAEAERQALFVAKFQNIMNVCDTTEREGVRKFAPGPATRDTTTAGKVSGWASTPTIDVVGDRIENGAFASSIASRGLTGPRAIKLLLDHDAKQPAGIITKLEYRTGGLWIEAELDLSVGYVRDRWSIIQKLGGFNFSVGFFIERAAPERGYRSITRGDLYEVSLVAFPANEDATASVAKGGKLANLLIQLQRLNASLK